MYSGGVLLLLLGLLLCFLFVDCGGDDVKGNPNGFPTPTDNNATLEGSTGHRIVAVSTKDTNESSSVKDLDGGFRGNIKKIPEQKSGTSTLSEDKDEPLKESVAKEEGKGSTISEEGSSSENFLKETAHVEECDVSSRCIDEKRKFVACLRVPGNDSPTLSLLIQNKGPASLTISILAPEFVKLEQSTVPLHPKEDRKVKVSVEHGFSDNPLLLTAGDWHCNLSFWEMFPDSVRKTAHPTVAANAIYKRASFIYVFLGAVVIMGAAYIWIHFRRARPQGIASYQMVETSLPVSSGGIKEADLAEGWDDSWGDGWDDEEAPKTPSNPALNLSSKGLASRRSNKEGWKD